jgi:hypothetical protein
MPQFLESLGGERGLIQNGEGIDNVGLQRMQTPELHDHEGQETHAGQVGAEKILPF